MNETFSPLRLSFFSLLTKVLNISFLHCFMSSIIARGFIFIQDYAYTSSHPKLLKLEMRQQLTFSNVHVYCSMSKHVGKTLSPPEYGLDTHISMSRSVTVLDAAHFIRVYSYSFRDTYFQTYEDWVRSPY